MICPSDPKKCIPDKYACTCNENTHSKVNRTYDNNGREDDCKQCAEYCTRLEGHCTFNDYCECPKGFKRTTETHGGNQKECHQCISIDKLGDGETCSRDADCGGNACKPSDLDDDDADDVCCDSTGQKSGCSECGGRNGECSNCRGTHIFTGSGNLGECDAKLDDGDECNPTEGGDDCFHGRCTPDPDDESKGYCCGANGGSSQEHCTVCEAGTGDCLECDDDTKYILRNGICSFRWVIADEPDDAHANCTCSGDYVDLEDNHKYGSSDCESTVGGRPFCFTEKDACIAERIPVTSEGVQQIHDFGDMSWAYAPCGHCPVAASSTCNTNNTCTCNPDLYTQIELTTRSGDACFQCYPYCTSDLGFCTASDNCECKTGFNKTQTTTTDGGDCYQCEPADKLPNGAECFDGADGHACGGDACKIDVTDEKAAGERRSACCDNFGQEDGCVSCELGTGKCVQCFTETHEFDRTKTKCVLKPSTSTATTVTETTTTATTVTEGTTSKTTRTGTTTTMTTFTGTTETTTSSTVTYTSQTDTSTTITTSKTATTKTDTATTVTTKTTKTRTTTTKTKTTTTDTTKTDTETSRTTTTATTTTVTTTTPTIVFTDSDTGEPVPVKKVDHADVLAEQRKLEKAKADLEDCERDGDADCSRKESDKLEAEANVRAAMGLEVSTADASTAGANTNGSGGSGGDNMVTIIIIVAVVVILAIIIAVVMVTRNGGGGGGAGSAVQSFENPMYDSGNGFNEPAYMDAGAAGNAAGGTAGYMDVGGGGAAATSGYMDVKAQSGGGVAGYMDVAPERNEFDGSYDNMPATGGAGGAAGYMDVVPGQNGFNDDSDEEV